MLLYSGSNLFLDNGHDDDARKVIGISCPMLLKVDYQGLSGINSFSGNKYISNFFPEKLTKRFGKHY